jgi:hypothetical protein
VRNALIVLMPLSIHWWPDECMAQPVIQGGEDNKLKWRQLDKQALTDD